MAASIVQLRVGNVTTAVPFQINRELLSATSPFHVTTLTADDSRVAMCVNDCIILTGSGEVPRAVLPNPPDALNFHVAFSDGSHFTRLQIELDSAGHTIGIPRDLQSAAPDIENLSTFRHAMEAARDCIALAHWPISRMGVVTIHYTVLEDADGPNASLERLGASIGLGGVPWY